MARSAFLARYTEALEAVPQGSFNDPDMLLVGDDHYGKLLTQDQAKIQMSIWAVVAAPLFIGGDVRTIPPA